MPSKLKLNVAKPNEKIALRGGGRSKSTLNDISDHQNPLGLWADRISKNTIAGGETTTFKNRN